MFFGWCYVVPMLSMNDIKIGTVITYDGQPYVVTSASHMQMGRGSAVLRTKLKNLLSGNTIEQTFKDGDKIEEADLSRSRSQFMYREGDVFHFMDNESYEQFSLPVDQIGEISYYVTEGSDVDVLNFEGKPVSISLPAKVTLTVVEAPPGIRGDTAQGKVTKKVKTDTGLTIDVPLFIEQGTKIVVNTETGTYVERA